MIVGSIPQHLTERVSHRHSNGSLHVTEIYTSIVASFTQESRQNACLILIKINQTGGLTVASLREKKNQQSVIRNTGKDDLMRRENVCETDAALSILQ